LLQEELAGGRVAGGFLLLHDARHADLEELVEVGADDREEADALQQGHGRIFREFKHAAIETEPTEFAVKHLRGRYHDRRGQDVSSGCLIDGMSA